MRAKFFGVLEGFFETGSEGIMWCLIEDGKQGYEGVHFIEEGDRLIVYGENNKVLFDGDIDCDYQIGWTEYPKNPGYGQPCALGYWIHWTQRGWQPDKWAKLFMYPHLQENGGKATLRAELTKKER